MELLTAKIMAMVLMGTLTLLFGLLPVKVKPMILKGDENSHRRRRRERIISGLLCFGAGVLFASVFIHMIPETREGFENIKALKAAESSAKAKGHNHAGHAHEFKGPNSSSGGPEHHDHSVNEHSSHEHGHNHEGHNHDEHIHNANNPHINFDHTENSRDENEYHTGNQILTTEHYPYDHNLHHRVNEEIIEIEPRVIKLGQFNNSERVEGRETPGHFDHGHNHDEEHDSFHHANHFDNSVKTDSTSSNDEHNETSVHSHDEASVHDHEIGHQDNHLHDLNGNTSDNHSHDHDIDQGHNHDHNENVSDDHPHEHDHFHNHEDHSHDVHDNDNISHNHHEMHHTTADQVPPKTALPSQAETEKTNLPESPIVTDYPSPPKENRSNKNSAVPLDTVKKDLLTKEPHIIPTSSNSADPLIRTSEPASPGSLDQPKPLPKTPTSNEQNINSGNVHDHNNSTVITNNNDHDHENHNHVDHSGQNNENTPDSLALHLHEHDHDHSTHEIKGEPHFEALQQGEHEHAEDEHNHEDHESEDHDYPMAELVVCVGFFIIYFSEEIMHKLLFKRSEEANEKMKLVESCGSEDAELGGHSHHHGYLHHHPTHNNRKESTMSTDHRDSIKSAIGDSRTNFVGGMDALQQETKGMPPRPVWGKQGVDNPVFAGDVDATSWNPKVRASITSINQVVPMPGPDIPKNYGTSHAINPLASSSTSDETDNKTAKKKSKIGISTHILANIRSLLVVVALSLHGIFEGMAVGLQEVKEDVWYLFLAISAHQFVIAFCVGLELLVVGTPLGLMVAYILILAIITPLGVGIGILVTELSSPGVGHVLVVTILQGLAGGTLLYVALIEILERERAKKGGGLMKLICLTLGFALMAGMEAAGGHSHSHS